MRAILTYHSIDRAEAVTSLSPDVFRAHVAWLASGRVQVVSLATLLTMDDSVNAVALTFDDGLASVASEAAPLLAAHALPATVFVVTRHVGGDNRWNGGGDFGIPVQKVLGWDALAELRAQGFTIGAHTRHHRHLHHCNHAELEEELTGAADDIATNLGERPTLFAYPYGDTDARVTRAAGKHFAACCTTEFLPVRSNPDLARVPRLDAWYFRDAKKLERWGSTGFRYAISARHALRRMRRSFR